MKTMLMFDLLTAKKLARSQLLLGVVVALVLDVYKRQTPDGRAAAPTTAGRSGRSR